METLRLVLAGGLALVAVAALGQLAWGYLQIPSLADVPPVTGDPPRVSIVVAARDEERYIEAATLAFLAQTYPSFELIVVDDRSQDGTAEILRRMATSDARIRVVRIETLRSGWLGKCHALQTGSEHAGGEWLLFADADVVLTSDALSRAIRLATVETADHLAVAPTLILPTWPLALVVNYFMMWFLLWLRPWKASDPRSSAFVGIGAFNLVRASAYRAVGGHSRIALRPDDDIMLGKVLKRAGCRQLLASADGLVTVEWYRSLAELARGFRKNAFAGLGYSTLMVVGTVIGNLALAVLPFAAVWITGGAERALYALAAVAQVAAYAGPAIVHRTRPWLAPLYPVAAVLFIGILVAAVARTLRERSIDWRGTRYSLDELRANRV
jgi:hypothetical protein